jgi:hypothetical protein
MVDIYMRVVECGYVPFFAEAIENKKKACRKYLQDKTATDKDYHHKRN